MILSDYGNMTDTMVEDLKMATRRYAKRQMTWFNSHGDVQWIDGEGKTLIELADIAESLINSKLEEQGEKDGRS